MVRRHSNVMHIRINISNPQIQKPVSIGSKMAIGASVAVIIQALLGAIVVFTELNPLVRLVHLLLAMTIILLLAITAFDFLSIFTIENFLLDVPGIY
ncbi:MAG: hypothetical protein CM1200mP38_2800 [Dehalococcoidia bacterium]|nr:MAG: hypothetical protein CM1200mP38_2800 [Dehalococcoidia bacterium]